MSEPERRQIVAMGGGGFSMEPDNSLLDRYVLGLARGDNPRVCFIPTASGDAADYIQRFTDAFARLPCRPTVCSLYAAPHEDLRSFILAQDVLYVGGGNTRNLLALWREWSLDDMLREAWRGGAVLAGVSAGMICWFDSGVTDSVPGATGDPRDDLSPLTCLGWLSGSACPHYDGEAARRPVYQRLVASGELPAGYAADDGVALHYVGERLVRVVSSRPDARAYRVERDGAAAREEIIVPDYLGA
ncbi:MAG TPA: peptidase E [Thermomicrobiales bacterium]|nr:peptidase E [Thermomicrobiales bacterium]